MLEVVFCFQNLQKPLIVSCRIVVASESDPWAHGSLGEDSVT